MASEELTVERPAGRRPHAGLAFLRELVFVVVGAIIVSSLLRAFVGQMFIIPSDSMQNTLLQGDRVVVQKITDFHRGNVVVFKDPADWLGDEPDGGRRRPSTASSSSSGSRRRARRATSSSA